MTIQKFILGHQPPGLAFAFSPPSVLTADVILLITQFFKAVKLLLNLAVRGGRRALAVGHPPAKTNERVNDSAKYALTFLKYEQKRPTCLATPV